MSRFTFCQECGNKLRHVAIFCAKCGHPSCSWQCHSQHLAQHATNSRPAVPADEAHVSNGSAAVEAESPA